MFVAGTDRHDFVNDVAQKMEQVITDAGFAIRHNPATHTSNLKNGASFSFSYGRDNFMVKVYWHSTRSRGTSHITWEAKVQELVEALNALGFEVETAEDISRLSTKASQGTWISVKGGW